MKITSVEKAECFYVDLDDYEWSTARTDGKGNWEILMGESWETEYHCEELERLFKEHQTPKWTVDNIPLPINDNAYDELFDEFSKCLQTEVDKLCKEQFEKVLKQMLLSGDITNVVCGDKQGLTYIPYKGKEELKRDFDLLKYRYEVACKVIQENGLMTETIVKEFGMGEENEYER